MESQSNGNPKPPLDQVFGKVGSFETLPDGTIIPTLSVELVKPPAPDPTDFQGGRPA